MAFQFSNEGVPYHPPVAPEVPVAPREPQGERLGGTLINAWVHAALGREQAKLEQERLYQNADIAAKQLNFQQDKLGQEYKLRSRALGIEETMRGRGMDIQEALQQPRIDELNAHADYYKNAVLGHTAANQSRAEMLGQFAKDAAPLEDATAWVNDPIGQAAKVKALTRQYAGSTDPGVKATIKSYQDRSQESKIVLPNIDGEGDTFYNSEQVAEDLARHGADSVFIPGLKEKGYIKETKDKGKYISGFKILPKGKELIGKTPEFKKAEEAPHKLVPGSGKVLKDMSDPNISTGSTAPVIDLGVQSPPGGPLPKPDMSSVEREAEWVKQQADPKYKAKFLLRHPDAAYLMQ